MLWLLGLLMLLYVAKHANTLTQSSIFCFEQLGIGKVVVYFLTAISVDIIWTIIHHVACFPFSSLDVGMCAGICYEYLLSRVMEVAYEQTANAVSILSIAYGLCYGLGIGKVVVYFVTAVFVAIVSKSWFLSIFIVGPWHVCGNLSSISTLASNGDRLCTNW